MKHFINLKDIPTNHLKKIIADAKKRKAERKKLNTLEVDKGAPLKGKILIQMFEKASSRTRISFYLAIKQLGGGTLTLRSNELHLGQDGLVGACILTWDVHGTQLRNVTSINLALSGYSCHSHGHLVVSNWVPDHEGYLTTGDNPRSNGCTLDQYIATGDDSHFSGLRDENGIPVTAVRPIWVSGIAGPEVPWFGIVKLAASSNASEVTSDAWMDLGTAVAVLILAVLIGEQLVARILQSAPEYAHSDNQSEENRQDEDSHEEE